MKTLFTLFIFCLGLPLAAVAAPAGVGDSQVIIQGLSANMVGIVQRVDVMNDFAKKIGICSGVGAAYDPSSTNATANGCVNPLAQLDRQVVSGSICQTGVAGDAVWQKTVTCPEGWQLLGCSGGSGDLKEGDEGYYIKPDDANGCQLVAARLNCDENKDWTRSWVFAFCGRLDSEYPAP